MLKIKIPKTIKICGKTYSINYDNSRWGGSSATAEQEIIIGSKKNQSPERIFENFVHEVMETFLIEKNLRYTSGDQEIMIIMTHKQFDGFAVDISGIFYSLLMENKNGKTK